MDVGDLVYLVATVKEYKSSTRLVLQKAPIICAEEQTFSPVKITLPISEKKLESLEGMAVEIPQTLTIIDNSDFYKWGEVSLAYLQQGNSVTKGQAHLSNELILDDNSSAKNPTHIFYTSSTENIRRGNKTDRVKGILDNLFNGYRIQPIEAIQFVQSNPRPGIPPQAKENHIRLASLNLYNYFNGPQFPTPRGGKSAKQMKWQRHRLIKVILALDAHAFALQELENDGFESESAIAELTQALNVYGKNYRYVNPKIKSLGSDEISVGIIYQADKLIPVGHAKHPQRSAFVRNSRIPLMQTFRQNNRANSFTLVVNHFKSRGSCPNHVKDLANQDHGQGCWNADRTMAAQKLLQWLEHQFTKTNTGPIFIAGDLNSYPHEAPISTLKSARFTDLFAQFPSPRQNYSFVYQNQAMRLDYLLVRPSPGFQNIDQQLKIIDSHIWHINVDEATHAVAGKNTKRHKSLQTSPWSGSSDHDPIYLDFQFIAVK